MAARVVNASPITILVSKLEQRITVPAHQDAFQARTSATSFESSRVTQEVGTH